MSTDGLFFSALQPKSTVTTYGLPSDVRLGNGGSSMSDEVSKARRVQEQVQMRLAQKSTLPRQNGGATSQYAMSGKRGLARFVCWLLGWLVGLTSRARFPSWPRFSFPWGGDVQRGGGLEGG